MKASCRISSGRIPPPPFAEHLFQRKGSTNRNRSFLEPPQIQLFTIVVWESQRGNQRKPSESSQVNFHETMLTFVNSAKCCFMTTPKHWIHETLLTKCKKHETHKILKSDQPKTLQKCQTQIPWIIIKLIKNEPNYGSWHHNHSKHLYDISNLKVCKSWNLILSKILRTLQNTFSVNNSKINIHRANCFSLPLQSIEVINIHL